MTEEVHVDNDIIKTTNERARNENASLNLNLGLPLDITILTRRGSHLTETNANNWIDAFSSPKSILLQTLRAPIQIIISVIDKILSILETPLYQLWSQYLPLKFRQRLTFMVWRIYLPIHKVLLGRRTGLHRDVSLEYHALTSVMWWGRLFPVTIRRMRFSLSQLHVWHPPEAYPSWKSIKENSSILSSEKNRRRFTHSGIHFSNHFTVPSKPMNGKKHGIHGHVYEVYHQMTHKRTLTGVNFYNDENLTQTSQSIPQKQLPISQYSPKSPSKSLLHQYSDSEMTVTGLYIQHSPQPSRKVIIWIYGGAFLAGDSKGNMGIAEKMGMSCGVAASIECNRKRSNCETHDGDDLEGKNIKDSEKITNSMRDVFIPDYRLVPEYHLNDAIHDVTLAYEYLIYVRGFNPSDITLLGISSGGGLVVLLLQALAEAKRRYDRRCSSNGNCGEIEEVDVRKSAEIGTITKRDNRESCSGIVPMPAGGVLMCPFVDYTEPKGSMKEYIKHDLIVNQSVFDEGIPYLEKVLGSHANRVRASPAYGNFNGLPPLCICVSEHEVVYDQTMVLARRAKEQGVDVTLGVWKYMCHVFPMLSAFIPEGRESFDFIREWIKKH